MLKNFNSMFKLDLEMNGFGILVNCILFMVLWL